MRADRVAIHRTSAGRARMDVALTIREAMRIRSKPGWAVRVQHTTDRLYAVRSGGRWRLAKLSRRAYALLGVRPPDDVDAPTAKATWPYAAVPSLSERAVPGACRRPFDVQGSDCPDVAAFAAGGGLVSWMWSDAGQTWSRPVVAGRATGVAATVSSSPIGGRPHHSWVPEDMAPMAGGALVVERDVVSGDVRAVPVGSDGRPRGTAQKIGRQRPSDGGPLRVVPGPPGATTATVLLASGRLVRLGADGRRAGTDGKVTDLFENARLLARPDGTVLAINGGSGAGLDVRAVAADGSLSGAIATQAWLQGVDQIEPPAVTQAADGRVLIAWIEVDVRGRGTLRAWAFDPAAPSASAPADLALQARDPDGYTGPGDEALVVDALPGGGWGVAWRWTPKDGGSDLWATRLDAAGALAVPPRRVTRRLGATALDRAGFGLAGDTVAFVESPAVAGLPQVRAAPLP